jgi:hypothetical protein
VQLIDTQSTTLRRLAVSDVTRGIGYYGYPAAGVYIANAFTLSAENLTINNAEHGLLTASQSTNLTFRNLIVTANIAYGVVNEGALATFSYSNFHSNGPQGASNTYGAVQFEANVIDADPLFADEDLHLLPTSPCIDSGDPDSDYANEPEPNGGRVNMGAYGNTAWATPLCEWIDVAQLVCEGPCSWAGDAGCDQMDADILCKLKTCNPESIALSYEVLPQLPGAGFSCPDTGQNFGPQPEYGVDMDVWYADPLPDVKPEENGSVVTNVVCEP